MFVLKACPRCSGDLVVTADGECACVQCGHELRQAEREQLVTTLRRRSHHAHTVRHQPALARAGR